MTKRPEDRGFGDAARRAYRDAADGLDPATRRALRRARARAVEAAGTPAVPWLPVSALAAGAGALVAGALLLSGPEEGTEVEAPRMAEDLEFLMDGEALDLLTDLEFYRWLETEPDVG